MTVAKHASKGVEALVIEKAICKGGLAILNFLDIAPPKSLVEFTTRDAKHDVVRALHTSSHSQELSLADHLLQSTTFLSAVKKVWSDGLWRVQLKAGCIMATSLIKQNTSVFKMHDSHSKIIGKAIDEQRSRDLA